MSEDKNQVMQHHTSERRAANRRRLSNMSQPDADVSLRLLISVFSHWWKILVPVTLLLVAVAVSFVLYTFEPKYRAAAWLQIKGTQPYVAFPNREDAGKQSSEKFVHTQIELLRSPLILGRVLSQAEIASMDDIRSKRDPVDWLAKRGLIITPKGESELLEIAYEGTDPDDAADMVNAIVDSYFTLRQEKRGDRVQSVIMLLEDERGRRAEEIKLLQTEVRQLQKSLVERDPTLSTGSLMGSEVVISDNPLKNIQENLSRAQIDQNVIAAQIQALELSIEDSPEVPDVLIDREISARQEVQEVMVMLNQKRAMLDRVAAASSRGERDPRFRKLAIDIRALEETLKSLNETIRPRIREELKAMAGLQRQEELADLRTQLETQKLVVQNMRSNYDTMVDDISKSGGQTMDLKFKQAELNRKQVVFDSISERAAQLATEMYAPSRVEPIQKATVPNEPVETVPWKMLLAAIGVSLFLPFGFCAIWERSVRRVTTADQLQTANMLPVVGEIARLPERPSTTASGYAPEASVQLGLFEESIDSLRTGLILSHAEDGIQVLVISSAVSGEGKTSVASQLAVSLARASGLPTLLIDGDMRSPDLHRIFQIEIRPGLTDVLSNQCELDEAINRQWSDNVHILPAGHLTRNPHKLMGSDRFRNLIEQARSNYRYIVIDTPPVLAASESLVMARHADATLVCAMRDVSRESHVRTSFQRLLSTGARPVGTVLNGVPTRQYARKYGSYAYTTQNQAPTSA